MFLENNQRFFYKSENTLSNYNCVQFVLNDQQIQSFAKWRKNSQWKMMEQIRYALYIQFNCKYMEGKDHNSLWNVYELMAKYIKTRNYRQCKLYHQKMLLKYKNIYRILEYLLNSSPQFEEILINERKNERNQQIFNTSSSNNILDKIIADSSYQLNSKIMQKQQRNSITQRNLYKLQKFRYTQLFAVLSSKLKLFIKPTLCA